MAAVSTLRLAGPPVGLAVVLYAVIASLRGRLSTKAAFPFVATLLEMWSRMPEEIRRYIEGALFVSLPVGIVGAIGGGLYSLFRVVVDRARFFLHKHCQATIVITNQDKHYDSIVDYIGSKCRVDTGRILASTTPRTRPSFQEMLAYWLGGKTKTPTLYYQPDIQGFADSFFWEDQEGKKHQIWIKREVERPQIRSNESRQKDPETLSLMVWWTTDSTILKEFLNTALKTMLRDDSGSTVDIYVKHQWIAMWTKAICREKRDRDTVILDEGQADFVVDDMRHFFSEKTAEWYRNAGIPYRRGYLLYGPPGCGKTSFAQVLAGELGLDVCLMNLSNGDMNDDELAELLRSAPAKSMLLLEDVDAIFVERTAGADKKGRGGGVSFSGLLNALDGAAAQEGCVIMLTTNHKDRLDEALIRPGRCDVHVKVEKASKTQAKRMFWRFFAKESVIKSCSDGVITCLAPHRLSSGNSLLIKQVAPAGGELMADGQMLENNSSFYVYVLDGMRIALYSSEDQALAGGPEGMVQAVGGKGVKLQEVLESGIRFSNRIPERQVSMAKLQGYLMKQKLLSEQDLKKKKEADDIVGQAASLGISEDVYLSDQVHKMASESSVMMVHELLDVRVEAEETQMEIYDHLRRVGLHQFAPAFEYYGVQTKKDVTSDLASQMESWLPELKMNTKHTSRLKKLLNGDEKLEEDYALADLSILRDRFMAVFRDVPVESKSEPLLPLPEPLELTRAKSAPVNVPDAPTRQKLLRATSGIQEDKGLKLLHMAHDFQEHLEDNGKTNVSMWQLEMHFQRYAGDPQGALENCTELRKLGKDRKPEKFVPMSMFAFLRRLGLEEFGFNFEDAGFKLWGDCVSLDKDKLKEHGQMRNDDAAVCHAVLSNNTSRPDILRKFHTPEFADLILLFRQRFPQASSPAAVQFARKITDELGVTDFSFHQVETYLQSSTTPAAALKDTATGLPTLEAAEAARKKPEPPKPPEPPTDWIYTWLKEKKMERYADNFMGQELKDRDEILDAPLDHKALQDMGINKLGDRCKILNAIEDEKYAADQENLNQGNTTTKKKAPSKDVKKGDQAE
mmetsp:Transcript_95300/g.168808  ORF Transcript_95300/g.168808 Transcript_95300/m.168808 type:complete len:1077 (-) Transcript_95300:85-3315(-)